MENFLKSNSLTSKQHSFIEDVNKFTKEIENGLNMGSSIPMLPTFINDEKNIPVGNPVLVLDAGGTNFRAAIVRFDKEKNPIITNFRKRLMPGFEREYKKDEFFDAITSFVEDIAKDVEVVGFCFSYPMVKTPNKDGKLIYFSKEIKAPEVEGKLIGEGVLKSFQQKNINNIKKIVVLNDTVATQLAGKAQDQKREFGSYIGIILGTGVNACYTENNSNILKEKTLNKNAVQIINTEIGSCNVMPFGKLDEEFRKITAKPEAYHFQKMVSGGYIGKLWFFTLVKAAEAGCFSEHFSKSLQEYYYKNSISNFDASHLSILLSTSELPECIKNFACEKDTEKAIILAEALLNRAAHIVSVMIYSIVVKSMITHVSDKPVNLCIDGSTYWKLSYLKNRIEKILERELGRKGIKYKITKIENAPILGAAVAGLTN